MLLVSGPEAPNLRRLEVAARQRPLRQQQIFGDGRRSPRSHVASGIEKPIFGRWTTAARHPALHMPLQEVLGSAGPDTSGRTARLAANSITLWSSSGDRTSSEFAIAIRSTFTRMSFGQIRLEVDVEDAAQVVQIAHPVEVTRANARERVVAPERPAEARRVSSAALVHRREEAHVVEVGLARARGSGSGGRTSTGAGAGSRSALGQIRSQRAQHAAPRPSREARGGPGTRGGSGRSATRSPRTPRRRRPRTGPRSPARAAAWET